MADETEAPDVPSKPGIIRRASGRIVGAALGNNALSNAIEGAIAGRRPQTYYNHEGERRAPPGIARRIASNIVGGALGNDLGSLGPKIASKIRYGGGNKRIPGMSSHHAQAAAGQDADPQLHDATVQIAEDINTLREDVEKGLTFLYQEIQSTHKAIDALRRDMAKPDSNESKKRLQHNLRDAKGRYAKKTNDADKMSNIIPSGRIGGDEAGSSILDGLKTKAMGALRTLGTPLAAAASVAGAPLALAGGIVGAAAGSNALLDSYGIANGKAATVEERKQRAARRQKEYDAPGPVNSNPRVQGANRPDATSAAPTNYPMPTDTGQAGRYNLRSSTGEDPRGDYKQRNIVPLNTPFGPTQVHKDSAAAFDGFFKDMHAAGAPLKTVGGYNVRQKRSAGAGHNPGGGWSEHSYGNAMDLDNATSLSPEMQKWIADDPERFASIKKKWNIMQGIKGDLPHIEYGGALPEETRKQLEAERKQKNGDQPNAVAVATQKKEPDATKQDQDGNVLAKQRAPFADQMSKDPALKEKMLALMSAEEGGDSTARRALAETTMNRASAKGVKDLNTAIDPNYYEPFQNGAYDKHLAKVRSDSDYRDSVSKDLDAVLKGSNHSNLATDNASGSVKDNAMKNSTLAYTGQNGEGFFRKDQRPDIHGAGNVSKIKDWYSSTSAALAAPTPSSKQADATPVKPDATVSAGTTAFSDKPKTPYNPGSPASFKVGEGQIAGYIDDKGKLSGMATSWGRSKIVAGFGENFKKLPPDVQRHLMTAPQLDMNKLAPYATLMPKDMRDGFEKAGLKFNDAVPASGTPPGQEKIKTDAIKVADKAFASGGDPVDGSGSGADATPASAKIMADDLGAGDLDKAEVAQKADAEKRDPSNMAALAGTDDLDKQQAASDAQFKDSIPTPPEALGPQRSGEDVTADVKSSTESASPAEDQVADAGGLQSSGSSSSPGSLRAPTHNPESEGPTPGSDGYGSDTCNPDSGGLCSV